MSELSVTRPRPNVIVPVLALGGVVVAVMQTLVVPLLPILPGLIGASAADTSWAITATLLAGAVATPVVGRLGDMYGKRRMLLISLAILIAGSVVAALSSTLVPLIVGRALQGAAIPAIPLGISIMRDELPAERLGSATAVMSASLGVGGSLGLPAAAILAENTNWHMLFWTSAALGAVVFALILTCVPESSVRTGGHFDVVGAIGLSAGLICLLLAISKGADWSAGLTYSLLGAGAVVLAVWGWWELRTRDALVDLRTTVRREVLLTNGASVVLAFSMFVMSLAFPQILQLPTATGYGLGQSMLNTGLVLVPSGLVMMAVAPVSARLSRARGPKVTLVLGSAIVAVGYALGIVLMSAIWQLVLISALVGAGIGFAYGAMPALIMSAVPVSETAAANGLNSLMRSIGTSVSSAVAGVILAHMTISFGPVSVPSQGGFRLIMAIGSATALAAAAVAAFIPARQTGHSGATPVRAAVPVPR
ncbi:MFS transporter [Kibdelosporangium phytohabitans]|uniref:MFS transporter n=1 Tax=Kibdelosporangium phytohabitans TaxID=860235 RepID=A0A0N7F2L6_9PSEU|nr:MFS transporter [Kibdelosporangium phytohabitans]ALG06175.1 MFS transporter [Kibdelosporangium phytohabitans]MBE1465728.1 MFS family permease [Kibdelosporangium phytohabitans]